MKKRTLIFGGSALFVVAALVIVFFVMSNQHHPEKTVEKFQEAVEKEDIDTLKEVIQPEHKDAEISKASLTGFTQYLKENNQSYELIKDEFDQQIEDDNYSSSNAQVSLVQDGKNYGMFPNYKVAVKTVNLRVKGLEDEDDKVTVDIKDFEDSLNKVEKDEDLYGPILPGVYEVEGKVKSSLGNLTKKEKVDLWGEKEISFLIDPEELARKNKKIQKGIIDTTNTFNESMSAFLTSGYDANVIEHVTKDFKKDLDIFTQEFKMVEDYIEEIESQFVKAIVNVDDIELNYFDGEWKAQVEMLVGYDEKIKLEDMKAEDISFTDIRKYFLVFDNDEKEWIIEELHSKPGKESDTDSWENKEVIEAKDETQHHKWPDKGDDKDSFL